MEWVCTMYAWWEGQGCKYLFAANVRFYRMKGAMYSQKHVYLLLYID